MKEREKKNAKGDRAGTKRARGQKKRKLERERADSALTGGEATGSVGYSPRLRLHPARGRASRPRPYPACACTVTAAAIETAAGDPPRLRLYRVVCRFVVMSCGRSPGSTCRPREARRTPHLSRRPPLPLLPPDARTSPHSSTGTTPKAARPALPKSGAVRTEIPSERIATVCSQ